MHQPALGLFPPTSHLPVLLQKLLLLSKPLLTFSFFLPPSFLPFMFLCSVVVFLFVLVLKSLSGVSLFVSQRVKMNCVFCIYVHEAMDDVQPLWISTKLLMISVSSSIRFPFPSGQMQTVCRAPKHLRQMYNVALWLGSATKTKLVCYRKRSQLWVEKVDVNFEF